MPPAARRVAVDVPVLDRLIEDRRERVDQLADRRRPERPQPSAAPVAQLRAGRDAPRAARPPPELVRLEGEAELAVDLVEPVGAEERQQVTVEPPAVVRLGVGVDRLVARARRRSSPAATRTRTRGTSGTLVARRVGVRRCSALRQTPARTRASTFSSSTARGALVPAAAAAALAAGALVEDHALALAGRGEPQAEGASPVSEGDDGDGTGGGRRHGAVSLRVDGGAVSPPSRRSLREASAAGGRMLPIDP